MRWGRPGEQLKLLNGNTVDGRREGRRDRRRARQVESLAGIMGGDATAVSDDTRNIYVEAAFWWPEAIQGRSRRFNFSTDAGHRFERGVDPSRTVQHHRAHHAADHRDLRRPGRPDRRPDAAPARSASRSRCASRAPPRVIGMPLTAGAVRAMRCAASACRSTEGDGVLMVTPPPHRFDLPIEEDLIEEVARLVGYNNLPTTPPLAPITARVPPEAQRSRFAVRHRLAALGYQETINFSFVEAHWEHELAGNADPIKLLNPIASQMSVMRSSLIGSLLQVLKFNLDRKARRACACSSWAACSCATTRSPPPTAPSRACTSRCAWPAWPGATPRPSAGTASRSAPTSSTSRATSRRCWRPRVRELRGRRRIRRCIRAARARVLLDGRAIGVVGELHPRWRQQWELRAGARAVRTRTRCRHRAAGARGSSRCPSTRRWSATSPWSWPKRSRTTR